VKVIYIAGKYRGPNAWAIEQNIRAAEDVAAKVWAMGHVALCPHANSRHMDGVASDEVFLAGTLELMRRCDAVVLVPNWRDSEGARAEVAEAERLGLLVFGKPYTMTRTNKYDVPGEAMCIVDCTMDDLAAWVNGDTCR
jgi:hypothetical protein